MRFVGDRIHGDRGTPPLLGAVTLGFVVTLFGACSPSDPVVRDVGTSAVIIGIDGADWKLIDELAAEGRMPNLSRLRARGISGPIGTLTDIALSPVIWTSVATGKSPIKHGVAWFMVDRADGRRLDREALLHSSMVVDVPLREPRPPILHPIPFDAKQGGPGRL